MTIALDRPKSLSPNHVAVRTFGSMPSGITTSLAAYGLHLGADPAHDARTGLLFVDGDAIRRSTSRFHFDTLARPTRALRNVVVSALTDLVLDTDVDRVLVVCTPGEHPTEPVIFRHWFGQVCADSWYHLTMSGGLPAPSITSKLFSTRATPQHIADSVASWCVQADAAAARPWQ
ncbi:hypothetical protein [Gordonia aichiensis]